MQLHNDTMDVSASLNLADSIYNILSKYDNRFTHTTGTTIINVDDIFDLTITKSGSYYIDGKKVPFEDGITYNVTTIITDTIVSMSFLNRGSPHKQVAICWIKQGTKNYFGVSLDGTNKAPIENLSFRSIEEPNNTYYQILKHAQFSLVGSSIVFITSSVLSDGAGNFTVLNDLRSCSNVTFNTTVSVNHSNYYAMGTNTLVRDDRSL